MARVLGVLGGMGPLASAFFMMRLTSLTAASKDQDHLPIVLWSNPHVPDRTRAWFNGGPSPVPEMCSGIRMLETSGAEAIAIPCNTAHAWYDDLARASSLPIIHIVDALIQELQCGLTGTAHVFGLMGTAATLRMRLYETRLVKDGYRCVSPHGDEIDRWITPSIEAIKAGDLALALPGLVNATNALVEAGATKIVLACTELPLLGERLQAHLPDIEFISTIDTLAMAALRWSNYPRAARGFATISQPN